MGSQRNEREMLADNTGHATGMQDSAAIYADNVVSNHLKLTWNFLP